MATATMTTKGRRRSTRSIRLQVPFLPEWIDDLHDQGRVA
jgi:hypothetical protein